MEISYDRGRVDAFVPDSDHLACSHIPALPAEEWKGEEMKADMGGR
jgi:hypothetical protein